MCGRQSRRSASPRFAERPPLDVLGAVEDLAEVTGAGQVSVKLVPVEQLRRRRGEERGVGAAATFEIFSSKRDVCWVAG